MRARFIGTVLMLLGGAGDPAWGRSSATPGSAGSSAPARAERDALPAVPPTSTEIAAAVESVAAAAAETDPARARDMARAAASTLTMAVAAGHADCWLLAVTAEAQLRAARPADARGTIALGTAADCDTAAMLQLSAWAAEFSPTGERRGEGADLATAESLHLRAAELFDGRPAGQDAFAGCLASAAELAAQRGAHDAGARHALRALESLRPAPDSPAEAGAGSADRRASLRQRLALAYLASEGRLVGEGAACDRLAEIISGDELLAILHVRLDGLRKRLDKGHDDPWALAAVGYYSILAGTEAEMRWADRYLGEAEAINPRLPDLWYLKGRAADFKSHIDEAKSAYRRQIKDHPAMPATRLATNELAHLLATSGGTPSELAEALGLLDAELAKTPAESAMIDTRGRVLLAMGRRAEGVAALERAQALEPTLERKLELETLRPAGR